MPHKPVKIPIPILQTFKSKYAQILMLFLIRLPYIHEIDIL